MYIKFNDSNALYNITLYQIKKNKILLKGENIPNNTSGFKIYKSDSDVLDCSKYTTIYNTFTDIPGGIIFSNTGEVEIEENKIKLPATPTLESVLKEAKQNKISDSKSFLAQYLEANPLQSSCHGGKTGAYSVTSEKQSLMMSQYMTHQIEKTVNPDAVLTWNESGKECEVWTEEEFLQLILEIKAYVYPLVSYQQNLEEKINACASMEELEAINIDYGVV